MPLRPNFTERRLIKQGTIPGVMLDAAIAILDQVADPPSSSRLPFNPMESSFADGIAALLGFGLFVFTGGRSYPYDDLETWLAEAGFSDVSYQGVRQSPGMSLVVARKPGGT